MAGALPLALPTFGSDAVSFGQWMGPAARGGSPAAWSPLTQILSAFS